MNQDEDIVKIKSYEIDKGKEIGRGQFGVVYQCKDLQNPKLNLCAKIIEERLDDPKTKREIELMKMIMLNAKGNKNIVGVEYVDFDTERIILILEKCECDLQQIIDKKKKDEQKQFTPNEALNILKQVVNGYKVLYSNNIIHRDLKPANILILNGVYKIADLGLARVLEANTELTKVGTPKYVAPQLFIDTSFSNSADIYSLGIITYELIFGRLPYIAKNQTQIKKALRNLEKEPVKVDRDQQDMTSEFADLIEWMLKFKENDRISWEQLFKHPLIQEESNIVVNHSGFIQNCPDSDDDDEEEPVQVQNPEQKPVEIQNNQQQQVSTNVSNQIKPAFPCPGPIVQQPQKQNCFVNPTTQQFTPGKAFATPFIPSNSIPTGNAANPIIQNSSTFTQPKSFIGVQPQRFATIPKMHILGQPLQFQQVKASSDQLFQAGFAMEQTLESVERFLNMQISLKAEFVGIKLYLHCLTQCFYQHSNAVLLQNQRNPNQQCYYSLQVVEQELQKQIKYHQELERCNLIQFYPVSAINPDFICYLQKLNRITQAKGLFGYQNDRKYYLDYLSFVYFLERLKELYSPTFQDLYETIADIWKNQKQESLVTDYLNKRF